VPLTPACLDLWSLVLLNRPGTVDDLVEVAALSDLPRDLVEAGLANLVEAGMVTARNGRLEPVPAEVAAATLASSIAADRAAADQRADEILGALFERLPRLIRDQELGRSEEGWLRLHLAHGPDAPRDVSLQVGQERGPMPVSAVLPDVSRLLIPPPEFQEPFLAGLAAKPGHDRILVTTEGARRPAAQDALEVYQQAGVEFRMLPSLPGWFGVEDDDVVVLPLEWGQSWPTSVVAMQHAGIAGLARTLFDLLWFSAQPLRTQDRSWAPLLRLMERGATVEAASRALGVTDRTGRRRIAAAMEHYGTSTLFALGIAFARDSSS
jgi:hypothetical protein